jgi:lipopolysaccharide heptosyltransferase III
VRILFITATRVGDAVLSMGILDSLIRRHPEARVTVACGPAAAQLFEAVPNLDRIIVLRKMRYSLHWLGMWTECIGRKWDILVDLRRAPLARLLFTGTRHHLARSRDPVHRVVKMAGVVGLTDDPPAPKIWTGDDHERRAAEIIPQGEPVLAIGPAANWQAKTWRPEYFGQLIERLTAESGILPGAKVALFGGPDERPSVMAAIESVPEARRIDLIGELHLLEVFACLKRCALYVGNDSGLMHMAAAAAIPTLGLFGPSREEHYAPWGDWGGVVRAAKDFDEIFPEGFDHRTSGSLMDSLSVESVAEAASELWQRTRGVGS